MTSEHASTGDRVGIGRLPTIRSRLTWLVVACMLPTILLGIGLIAHNYIQGRAALSEGALATARATMSAVDQELASAQTSLMSLATSPNLNSENLLAFYEQAKEVVKSQDAISIFLLDPDFGERFNTLRPFDSPPPPKVETDLGKIFKTGRRATSNVFTGRIEKRPLIAVGVPIFRGGTVHHVLGATLAPERLSALLVRQRLPGWISAILDSYGTIVARSHQMERFVGTQASPLLIKAMEGGTDAGALQTNSVEGIPVLVVFTRSSFSDWTLAIGVPTKIMNESLWETLVWLIVSLLILLASGLTLAWTIGRRIAASIHKLVAPALALGSGNEVTVPELHLREADEVGRALRRAFAMLSASQHKATHDPLTGLANRTLFDDILTQQLEISSRTKSNLSIVCLDLDGFKPVNDAHGHAVGDEVLCEVSARLKFAIREFDLAARLGGDEFALILVHAGSVGAQTVAEKLIVSLSAPYQIGALTLHLSASIGVATYPDAGTTSTDLAERADEAMYRAKAMGRRRYCTARSIAGNSGAALAIRQSP